MPINIMNRNSLITPPCFTPFFFQNQIVSTLLILVKLKSYLNQNHYNYDFQPCRNVFSFLNKSFAQKFRIDMFLNVFKNVKIYLIFRVSDPHKIAKIQCCASW